MGRFLKNICDCNIISDSCRERFLPLQAPGLIVLREREVSLGGLSDLRGDYFIGRTDPRFHVLLYTLSGRGRLLIQGKTTPIQPGHLLILPAHTSYGYSIAARSWRIVWFHLRVRKTWSALEGRSWELRLSPWIERMAAAVEGLLEEFERPGYDAQRCVELYSEIIDHLLRREVHFDDNPHDRRIERQLRALWTQVDSQLAFPWTSDHLSRLIHVSRGHLHRLVVEHYRRPPMEMVFLMRMRRAELLLNNTDDTIAQIAARIGYENPFAFSTAFKRYQGLSPRDFRRKIPQPRSESDSNPVSSTEP